MCYNNAARTLQYYQGSAETAAAQLAALVREEQQDAAVAAAARSSSDSNSGATAELPENHGKLAWADALSRLRYYSTVYRMS
jgi:hypothetical protein